MTATPAQFAATVNRFETARRILGHAATVTTDVVDRAFDVHRGYGHGNTRTGMIRYAYALVAARDAAHDDNLPDPVLPRVDVANLQVTHTTCTGNTTLLLDGGHLRIERHGKPLDPTSPRDIALWILADQVWLRNAGQVEDKQTFARPAGRAPHGDADLLTARHQLAVLEGIAVLIEHGMTVEDACIRASKRGIPADPTRVREEIESRRVGLWLASRPWLQAAHRAMIGVDRECRYSNADLPDWARHAAAQMRHATDNQGSTVTPKKVQIQPDPVADWERELMEGGGS